MNDRTTDAADPQISAIDKKIAAKQAEIARAQADIARLQKDRRAAEAGGKIVLGGLVLAIAKTDQALRHRLINEATLLPRENDRTRALALLRALPEIPDLAPASPPVAPTPSVSAAPFPAPAPTAAPAPVVAHQPSVQAPAQAPSTFDRDRVSAAGGGGFGSRFGL